MEIPVAIEVQPDSQIYNDQQRPPSRNISSKLSVTYPQQSGGISSANGNRTVRFLIEANGFLDGKASYVALNAIMTGTPNLVANNFSYFNPNTDTWIKRLTILTSVGGIPIEDMQNYFILAAQETRNTEPAYYDSVGKESLNMFDSTDDVQCEIASERAFVNKRYVISLRLSGFLNMQKLICLKALAGQNSSAFTIEIEFCSASEMISAYNLNPGTPYTTPPAGGFGYQLSNIEYWTQQIFDPQRENELVESIKNVPIVYHYRTHKNAQSQIQNNTNQTLNITEFQASVVSMQSVFRPNISLNNQNYDSTLFSNPTGVLKSMQTKVGSNLYPAQKLLLSGDTGTADMGQQYYEYLKNNQKVCKYERGFFPTKLVGTISNKENTDLILSTDFRVFPDDVNGDARYNDFTSGINTKSNPTAIQLNLEFNTAPPLNGFICDTFVKFDSNLIVQFGMTLVLS